MEVWRPERIEEKRPKRVDVRLHINDGEGVTDGERHVAVVLSDALNQKLRVAAQLSSFTEASK